MMPRTPAQSPADPFRSGFVTFVGRPNVGKSTLTNALVGEKVAITSDKPQTTRRAIRGILNRPDGQLVIVDTPGIHRPRTLLGERLNHLVEQVLGDVDVIGFCVPVTKTDAASREQVTERLLEVDALRDDWAAVIPLSALTNEQLDVLTGEVLSLMPEGPALYPEGVVTDESVDDRIAEIIREAALEGVRDELPHSIAVVVQDIAAREDSDLTDIFADVVIERDSQKSIIIGHKGSRLADVGRRARAQIEPLIGSRVYLSLHVRVAKEWQRDPKQLGRLGF
jgi:GTP-binding protein Era